MNRKQRRLCAAAIIVLGWIVMLPAVQAVPDELPVSITVDANRAWVRAGDDVLLLYRYGDVPFKPYVKELFTPSGLNVLLDSPADHIHHHALMFAVAVDGVTYWAEYAGAPPTDVNARPGKQEHQRFPDVAVVEAGGLSWGRFAESVRWVSPRDNRPALNERRAVAATRLSEPATILLTWQCELAVPAGKESVILSGSHYYGLGLRFIRAMDADGTFRNPDGKPGTVFRGDERLVRSNWCAYTARTDGKDVTVAMFGHPDNARHPTTWFTMARPFAYLSATLGLHETPLKVAAGKPLSLCYGVALWDGRVESARIDKLYQRWVAIARNDHSKP